MSVEGEQEVELSMSSTRLRVETRARLDRFSAPRRHAALRGNNIELADQA